MARPKEQSSGTLHVDDLTDELTCAICNDRLKNPKYLHCFHTYCEKCLQELAKRQTTITCPLCREKTSVPDEGVEGLKTNLMALNLVEKITSQQDEERIPGSKATVKLRASSIDVKTATPEELFEISNRLEEKLRICRKHIEITESANERISNEFEKARSKLQSKTDLVVSKVIENSRKVTNTLTVVERQRLESLKRNIEKLHARENRLTEVTETVAKYSEETGITNNRNDSEETNTQNNRDESAEETDATIICDDSVETEANNNSDNSTEETDATAICDDPEEFTDANSNWDEEEINRSLKEVIREEESQGVSTDLEHIEVSTDGLSKLMDVMESTKAALVYGDTEWTLYATTKDEQSFEGARGVDIDEDGYIVIADCKPDSTYGVIGIDWDDVEKYLAVDETFPRDEEDEFDVENINEYEEAARDVVILPDDRVAVASADKDIDVYDIEDCEHIQTISPPNPSTSLWALAVDQNKAMFVGNGASNQISRHEKKRKAAVIETNLKPSFIAANSNLRKILVSNWRECRVDVIDYEGQSLFSIQSRGSRGRLRPTGVCFHGDDTIYIVHRDNKKGEGEVIRYRAEDGSYVGVAVKGLENPHGICIGYEGYMLVADWKDVKIFKRKELSVE